MYSSLILLYCFLVLSHYIFLEFLDFFIISPVKTAVQAVESLCPLILLARERFLIFNMFHPGCDPSIFSIIVTFGQTFFETFFEKFFFFFYSH